jgi:chromosome segregation ATPase
MKLRRLLPVPSGHSEQFSALSEESADPDWALLTELDRLRSTNTGLAAEVDRQTHIGQDYARAASEQRLRVEELERETAIAFTNCQLLERRVAQTEEHVIELDELVESLRGQRDRFERYYEQQKQRADRAEAAAAMMRDAAAELLAANDRHSHAPTGTRGLARAKVEYEDALGRLRRSLAADTGKECLTPEIAAEVRRYFTMTVTPEQEAQLREKIVRELKQQPSSRSELAVTSGAHASG